jgi:hypothetical protein|tara:strand:- start:1633 stop:2061 length:429 start_codon:yes stop_codon:yes gene_type:complete
MENSKPKETQVYPIRINEMIIERVQGRLDLGAKKYGDTIALDDRRDMVEETLEEVLDAIVYSTSALIQLQYKRREKKGNEISTKDLTIIMEGLALVLQKGQKEREANKTEYTQQLIDRLTDYANEFWDRQKRNATDAVQPNT